MFKRKSKIEKTIDKMIMELEYYLGVTVDNVDENPGNKYHVERLRMLVHQLTILNEVKRRASSNN